MRRQRRRLPPVRRRCRKTYSRAEILEAKKAGWWHPAFQATTCKYVCTRKPKVAQLAPMDSKHEEFAILHPSTKERGKWQISLFDKHGPWGDRVRDTCSEAVQELAEIYQRWRVTDWAD